MAGFYAYFEELELGPQQRSFMGPIHSRCPESAPLPIAGDEIELRHRNDPRIPALKVRIKDIEVVATDCFVFHAMPLKEW